MPSSGLAAEIEAFLDAHIDSIPQMEILMLLHEGRLQSWAVDVIASRVYRPPAEVVPLLRGLQAHGLAGAEGAGEALRFRFADRPESRELLERVAVAHRTQLIEVTRFVHAKASRSVLEFARAFDLTKDRQ